MIIQHASNATANGLDASIRFHDTLSALHHSCSIIQSSKLMFVKFFFFFYCHMLGTILISMLTVSKYFITIFGWSTKTHLFSSSFILCAFFCLRLLFLYRYSVIKHSYADCVSAFSHIDGLKSMRFVLIEWLREILNRNEYKMCL